MGNNEKKMYYTWQDIAEMYGCKRCKAQNILATIKLYSDMAHIKGKVTIEDFEYWRTQNERRI